MLVVPGIEEANSSIERKQSRARKKVEEKK
jgi:hypothetical protein